MSFFLIHNALRVTEEAVNETEKISGDEKPAVEDGVADANKESPANETEEKEPEDKVCVYSACVDPIPNCHYI